MPDFRTYTRISALCISLLFFSNTAIANKVPVGDWTLDVGDNYTEAFTGNVSGSTFGFFCYGESCSFYVNTNTKCDQDAQIPILINSDSGATFVNTSCTQFPTKDGISYYMTINDKDVATSISKGDAIGFAFPLVGGQFKVVRFSLHGALDASNKAATLFSTLKDHAASPKYRDTTM